MKSRFIETIADATRPGWRKRRAKRKSLWNLACGLTGLAIGAVFWYGLFWVAWKLHVCVYPDHALQKGQFWDGQQSAAAFVSSFLMLMPLGFPALILGLLAGNCAFSCIPWARRTMDKEAAGDREMSFRGVNAGLIKWGGLISAPCIVLSIIGNVTLTNLR